MPLSILSRHAIRVLLAMVAVVVVGTVLTWRYVGAEESADSQPDAASTPQDPAAASDESAAAEEDPSIDEDLRGKIELILSPKLTTTGRTRHYVTVSIKNITEEDLPGPIRFAVLGTKVDALKVHNADGSLQTGHPFFELLGEGKHLPAGKRTSPLRVVFASENVLEPEARQQFELEYRVTRDGLAYAENQDDPLPKLAQRPANDDRPYDENHPEVQKVMALQEKFTDELMAQDRLREGIYATGVTLDDNGRLAIRVYISRLGIADGLPKSIGGVPVVYEVTSPIRPRYIPGVDNRGQAGRPLPQPPGPPLPPCFVFPPFPPCDSNRDPQTFFARPVPIGVEIFNVQTTVPFFGGCSVGTLGCRVRRGGQVFILSNNHVMARENLAAIGERIGQPGCFGFPAFTVARLSQFAPITFGSQANNVIDAAIAQTNINEVERITPCWGYGAPSEITTLPSLGMDVQKVGRTTGHTKGVITAINVTVFVQGLGPAPPNPNPPPAFLPPPPTRFLRQIEIRGKGTSFSSGGDSGSLIVTDPGRRPVGLLFAGNISITPALDATFANPINAVLRYFNVRIEGDCK